MNTLGVLVVAAATVTGGFGKPHAWTSLFRPHVVKHGPPPASGPIMPPGAAGAGLGMADCGPLGVGPAGAGFAANRRFPNTSSQVFFVDPPDMQIGWQTVGVNGQPAYLPAQLTVPARYNFRQGYIYRLKLTNIPDNPGLVLYPSIEVAPSTPVTDAYLTHNPIPLQFTQEDFDQVRAGNFVTKVVYLPDPEFQELAIAGLYGAETLVSTRLEPGIDPILEADKRGSILMIVRVGAIDLEMPEVDPNGVGPAIGAGEYIVPGSTVYESVPEGMEPMPPGMTPPATPLMDNAPPPPATSVPLDQPPVTPAEPGSEPEATPAEEVPAPAEAAPEPPAEAPPEVPEPPAAPPTTSLDLQPGQPVPASSAAVAPVSMPVEPPPVSAEPLPDAVEPPPVPVPADEFPLEPPIPTP